MKITFNSLMLPLFCCLNTFSQTMRNDVVINEIMFNPAKNGFDYVEVYNQSARGVNLNHLLIANRNSTGDIASPKMLTKDTVIIQPGGYFVLTANEKWVRQHYNVPPSAKFLELPSIPSFPDDQGTAVLIRRSDSLIIDELHYNEKWHSEFISNSSGVALERIDPNGSSNDPENWTSASTTSRYGTPGFRNSQFREIQDLEDGISDCQRLFLRTMMEETTLPR
jgi:hypothetical protein